jgi:hypothetical protein
MRRRQPAGRRRRPISARLLLGQHRADPGRIHPEAAKHLPGPALDLDHTEQDVLGLHVVFSLPVGQTHRPLQRSTSSLGEVELTVPVHGGRLAHRLGDLLPAGAGRDPDGDQGPGRPAVTLGEDAEQKMLCPDVVVPQPAGFSLSQIYRGPGLVAESLEHGMSR